MKRLVAGLIGIISICLPISGQELEYKMELGGGVGGCFYLGDANSTPFKNLGGMGGIMARYIFNPRMAVKGNLAWGHISGNSDHMFFPEDPNSGTPEGGAPAHIKFSRNIFDLGAQFEFNFWGYGTGNGFKDNKRITPYMLAGIGMTFASRPAEIDAGLNIPLGIGIKYKIKERINIGLEWSVRFTTCDALDVSNNQGGKLDAPYGITSGSFKNKDCYSFTQIFLTYDLFPKYRQCNN